MLIRVQKTIESSTYEGLYETQFESSVEMSTYLVEFIVADFGFVENITESGIPVSILLHPNTGICIVVMPFLISIFHSILL